MSSYSLFTFESLCTLHLGVSRLVMECNLSYLFSDRLRFEGRSVQESCLLKYKCWYSKGAISCSAVFKVIGFPETRIDSSKGWIKSVARNIHKDWPSWDPGEAELPIIKQSVSICVCVHRSEHRI